MKKYIYLLLIFYGIYSIHASDLQGVASTTFTENIPTIIITHANDAGTPNTITRINPNRPPLVRSTALWDLLSLLKNNADSSSQTP